MIASEAYLILSENLNDLPGEIWKDIVGYEGLYQVSNMGRVKSFCERIPRILSPCPNKKGYYMVHLHKDGKKRISVFTFWSQSLLFPILKIKKQ